MSYHQAYKSCSRCSEYNGLARQIEPSTEVDVIQRAEYLKMRDRSCSFAIKALEELKYVKNIDLSTIDLLLDVCATCKDDSPSIAYKLRERKIIRV